METQENFARAPYLIQGRKIGVALMGCGRIAQTHFDAIKQHAADLELKAVCDVAPDLVQRVAQEQGCRGYLSLEEMLRQPGIDLVVLCTPSGLHAQQVSLIAQHGRHVVTEKPMATTLADGLRMIKETEERHVRLFVVKQNRLNPTLQRVKKAINQGRLGKIYLVVTNVLWFRPQSYYDQAAWRGTMQMDGGALMNQASHYVDLLYWLFGPIESVQAMAATLARKIETEDTAVVNLKWVSGTLGSVSVTMLTYPQNLEGSITIIGEKGTIKIGGVAVNEIQYWKFDQPLPEDDLVFQTNYNVDSVYGFGHERYYENVIQVLRGQAEPHIDGREGLKSLEILVAAYLASKQGNTIHLPLETQANY